MKSTGKTPILRIQNCDVNIQRRGYTKDWNMSTKPVLSGSNLWSTVNADIAYLTSFKVYAIQSTTNSDSLHSEAKPKNSLTFEKSTTPHPSKAQFTISEFINIAIEKYRSAKYIHHLVVLYQFCQRPNIPVVASSSPER